VSPPVVVGRAAELETLRTLLGDTASGTPTIVLLGGDAGVGKTAFARAAVELAESMGFQRLNGACLSVEAGVPFAPVVEALRPILTESPDRLGPAGTTLLRLLPGSVSAVASGPGPHAGLPPGQVLDLLLAALGQLAGAGPVMLVLEDMHWADTSTRELAVHLARNLRGPVCLLLSYRSDDLHRRHPLRPVLTELTRSAGAEHVDLGPLDREDLAELLANLLERAPDPSVVGAVLARSGGNPLFAEELIAAGAEAAQMPPRLADLLLARIDSLTPPTARMLRLASAGGARVDTQLLALVLDETPEQVEAAAREAVDFNVLALRAGCLEFRHELLREAAYDDLLPGERSRVHGRLAAAMEKRLEGSGVRPTMNEAAQIAYHWGAANQLPPALRWSLMAGQQAARLAAPESVVHLDRVLELWDQVPGARDLAGICHSEILLLAAESSHIAGHLERALALLDRAIEEVDQIDEPLLASRIYGLRGSFCGGIGDTAGRLLAVDRAVELAEGEASAELAGALAVKAARRGYDFQLLEAITTAQRAVAVAQQVGSLTHESNARQALGWALVHTGSVDEGLAQSRRGVEIAAATGRDYDEISAAATLAFLLFTAGRPHEAIRMADEAARRSSGLGLRWTTSFCVNQRVESLLWTGQFDAADISMREMVELERGLSAATLPGTSRMFDGLLRLWRGDLEGAVASLAAVTAAKMRLDDFSAGWEAAAWLAQAYARQGKADGVEVAVRVANAVQNREGSYPSALAATTLFSTLWLLGRTQATRPELELGLATLRLAEAAPDPGPGTQAAAYLAEARAWAATATGSPDPGLWAAAVSAWDAPGFNYPATEARGMLANALLAAGERDAARAETVRAWTDANGMGAAGLAERLGAFARRARFVLHAAAGTPSPLDVLTPREREVLALLADGASNRVIGQQLFISTKTAGVHVSNLLGKLGVSSRLEAAALAHRSGLEASRLDR
jgi:DNA-binding CsgD family transcriptional regulator/tetratricopeptide (TPR) repeat protein